MRSWTLWEPRLNSIATHARLWAGEADATHPKNRSSSMTSVTGSPTDKDSPDNARASLFCQHGFALHNCSPCDGLHRIGDLSEECLYVPAHQGTCSFTPRGSHAGRLPHGGEGRRHEQLVFLPDRPHPGLGRPRAASLAGGLTDAGALVEILVHPGVDELVQPAELARPAGRQGRELLPRLNGFAPPPPAPWGCRPGRRYRSASHTRSRCRSPGCPGGA